jgi:glycosyl transferase family 25
MKTFVINLERSKERRAYIERHLQTLGLDFEIIPGVDGRLLSEEDLARLCNLEAIKRSPHWLNKGAIGCALSHMKVYERMVEEKLDFAFIIEDDLVLPKTIITDLKEIEKEIKQKEIIQLFFASFTPCPLSRAGMINLTYGSLVYPVKAIQPISAAAYCISKKAAEGMIKHILPIRVAADAWNHYYKLGAFDSLRCFYPLRLEVKHFKSVIDYIDPNSKKGVFSEWLDKAKIPGVHQLLKWVRKQTIKKKTNQFFLTDEVSQLLK